MSNITAATLANSWKMALRTMAGKWVYFAALIVIYTAFSTALTTSLLGDFTNPDDINAGDFFSSFGLFLFLTILPYYFISLLVLNLAVAPKENNRVNISNVFSATTGKFFSYFKVAFVRDLLVIAGTMFFIIPGIYLGTKFYLAEYAAFFKRSDLGSALDESSDIVDGGKLRIFLLFMLVPIIVNQVLQVLSGADSSAITITPALIITTAIAYFINLSIKIAGMNVYIEFAKPAK